MSFFTLFQVLKSCVRLSPSVDTALSGLRCRGTRSLWRRQEQPTCVTQQRSRPPPRGAFPARLLVITQKLDFSVTSSAYPPLPPRAPSPRPALGLQNEMQG